MTRTTPTQRAYQAGRRGEPLPDDLDRGDEELLNAHRDGLADAAAAGHTDTTDHAGDTSAARGRRGATGRGRRSPAQVARGVGSAAAGQVSSLGATAAHEAAAAESTLTGRGSWVGILTAMLALVALYLALSRSAVVAKVVTDISNIVERIVAPVPLF